MMQVSDPFFSIVIPTKNRPGLLKDSIRSVLLQDFGNFELIISDNFNDQETKNTIEPFLVDPRVKYLRTQSELNMPDHWEFASNRVRGEWIILLADRKVLFRDSLSYLYKTIIKHKGCYKNYSFRVKTYNNIENHMGWYPPARRSRMFRSMDLLENFMHENYLGNKTLDQYFPKTLNSCYHQSLANEIRENFGRYFNIHGVTTPDYSSCFFNLLLTEKIFFIGRPMIMTQGEDCSNGRIFTSGNTSAYQNALGLNDDDLYAHVPVRAPFVINWIMHDLMVIDRKIHGTQKLSLDLVNYYTLLKEELIYKNTDKKKYAAAIDTALNQEIESVQEGVKLLSATRKYIREKNKQRFSEHIRDFINFRFSKHPFINRIMKYRFKSVMEAAGFDV